MIDAPLIHAAQIALSIVAVSGLSAPLIHAAHVLCAGAILRLTGQPS